METTAACSALREGSTIKVGGRRMENALYLFLRSAIVQSYFSKMPIRQI